MFLCLRPIPLALAFSFSRSPLLLCFLLFRFESPFAVVFLDLFCFVYWKARMYFVRGAPAAAAVECVAESKRGEP